MEEPVPETVHVALPVQLFTFVTPVMVNDCPFVVKLAGFPPLLSVLTQLVSTSTLPLLYLNEPGVNEEVVLPEPVPTPLVAVIVKV